MSDGLEKLSACQLVDRLRAGEVSAEAVVAHYLERIAQRDRDLNCYLWVDGAGSLRRARDVDRRRAAGQAVGELAGIPIAIKDNIGTEGRPTTCASVDFGKTP